jgi:type II secretory pathway predicted ATPase ExeA/cell division septation protein DedD
MYFQHFGLRSDPFPLTPRLHLLFQSRSHEETMAHLVYGIEQEESILLITGGIGTGKTLALQNLISQLSGVLEPVLINVTQFSWPELVRYILHEMDGAPDPRHSLADLLHQLKGTLQERARAGRRVLLIIDEAQHLDVEALEGLRLLLNIGTSDRPALQLILTGQLALEDTIARRDLAQLGQRIRVRYRLEPLSRREVEEYIDHRIQVVGGRAGLFDERALDRIWSLSGGIPRVVNILASRALLAAYVARQDRVQPHHVREEDLPPLSDADPGGPVTASDGAGEDPPKTPAGPQVAGAAFPTEESLAARPAVPPPDEPSPSRAHEAAPRPRRAARAEGGGGRGRRVVLVLVPLVLLLGAAGLAWQLDVASLRTRLTTPLPDTADSTPARDPALVGAGDGGEDGEDGTTVAQRETPVDVGASGRANDAPRSDVDAGTGPAAPAVPASSFVAHLASFQDATLASSYQEFLERAGARAFSRTVTVDGKAWVRVFVGPFSSTEQAWSRVDALVRDGLADYAEVVEKDS